MLFKKFDFDLFAKIKWDKLDLKGDEPYVPNKRPTSTPICKELKIRMKKVKGLKVKIKTKLRDID